jgi:L-amino acid N-acyltransferase YncA
MTKRIRRIELSDAEAVREIYAPFVSDGATSFETDAPDTPAIEQRIRELSGHYPWLVFEADAKVLGYAYACSHRARRAYQWCVEVSVYTHELARHCGVGRALYTSLFEILRRQGYVNVYAGITLPNPASIGLHESMGFVSVGVYPRIGFKFGKWHDVAWLQLRLSEADTPVPEPVPARELFGDARIAEVVERQAQAVRYAADSRR